MVDSTVMPVVGLELSADLEGIIKITCHNCYRLIERPMRNLYAGEEISCPCGAIFCISNDRFREAQLSFDALNTTLQNFCN